MSLVHPLSHASQQAVEPLQEDDYDHEIRLIDSHGSSVSASEQVHPVRKHRDRPTSSSSTSLRKEIAARNFAKYQESQENQERQEQQEQQDAQEQQPDNDASKQIEQIIQTETLSDSDVGNERPSSRDGASKSSRPQSLKDRVTAIDVLYENERGGFLCGIPLFSSKALGNLDPSPWTSTNMKTSPTDIYTKQVPDPSWEWVWPEWRINHDTNSDPDGWEYSFAFHKWFGWHGPNWWSSCVRRRAWIRRRAKKLDADCAQDRGLLDPHYFSVQPAQKRPSTSASVRDQEGRRSLEQLRPKGETDANITEIGQLMSVLRASRIDREKMEAIDNFIEHADGELFFLHERMHDIMKSFIFQTSRRTLLAHMTKVYEQAEKELHKGKEKETDPAKERKLQNLQSAWRAADREVKSLEYWSDIKDLATAGHTKGAADPDQGWSEAWAGIDQSGPNDAVVAEDIKPMKIELDAISGPSLSDVVKERKSLTGIIKGAGNANGNGASKVNQEASRKENVSVDDAK